MRVEKDISVAISMVTSHSCVSTVYGKNYYETDRYKCYSKKHASNQ